MHVSGNVRHGTWLALVIGFVSGTSHCALAGEQLALLVGISEWDRGSNIPRVNYTETDMEEVGRLLERAGYDVTVMTRRTAKLRSSPFWPSRTNILTRLDQLAATENVDQLLVICACHGVMHIDGERRTNYILPADATMADGTQREPILHGNFIAYNELFDRLDASNARRRFLFVDACRAESFGLDPSFDIPLNEDPSGSTIAFYSCRQGQTAKEDTDNRKASYFGYYLAQALKGRARDRDEPWLTFGELYDYVRDSVRDTSLDQDPEYRGSLRLEEIEDVPIAQYVEAGSRRTENASFLPRDPRDWSIGRRQGLRTIVEDVTFTGDFDGTNLAWMTFRDCRFVRCRFVNGVNVTNTRMIDCVFDGADFSGNRGLRGLQVYGYGGRQFVSGGDPWDWDADERPGKVFDVDYENVRN